MFCCLHWIHFMDETEDSIPMNSGVLFPTTNVIDTYVYRALIEQGNISMSSAAGVYQSLVGFVIVMLSNWIVRRVDKDRALF